VEDLISGEIKALKARGISEEACLKYGYKVGVHRGKHVQIAEYYLNGNLIAQHLRTPEKDFSWIGDSKHLELFGQHLWRTGGKRIVITEGEIDCLTIAQAFNLRWPVVSVPNGAPSAARYLKQQLEYLETYDEIVLAFDNDEQGKQAIAECAILFSPGKVKVANFTPFKDANEQLQAGHGDRIAPVIFEAKVYRPDGIVAGEELSLDYLRNQDNVFSFDLPYPELNGMLKGLRKGELTTLTAGSGIGKSTLAREMAYHLLMDHHLSIGYVALEESVKKSALGLMAIDMNKPLGDLFLNRNIVTTEQFEDSYKRVIANERLYLYDHFGSLESENLIAKMKYLAVGCGVDFIILDHISIVVSGIEGGEERRIIDNLMTNLRSLVENSGVGMIVISHLKVPEGTPHEEGGRVTLNQLRGSGSIKQLSDNIIGLERNQQGKDPNKSKIRLLKNRLFGFVGLADKMRYDKETGRFLPYEEEEETDDELADEFKTEDQKEGSDF
jgi:twinkle protein